MRRHTAAVFLGGQIDDTVCFVKEIPSNVAAPKLVQIFCLTHSESCLHFQPVGRHAVKGQDSRGQVLPQLHSLQTLKIQLCNRVVCGTATEVAMGTAYGSLLSQLLRMENGFRVPATVKAANIHIVAVNIALNIGVEPLAAPPYGAHGVDDKLGWQVGAIDDYRLSHITVADGPAGFLSSRSYPAAAKIAPQTPPTGARPLLAALTMTSTYILAMSFRTISKGTEKPPTCWIFFVIIIMVKVRQVNESRLFCPS